MCVFSNGFMPSVFILFKTSIFWCYQIVLWCKRSRKAFRDIWQILDCFRVLKIDNFQIFGPKKEIHVLIFHVWHIKILQLTMQQMFVRFLVVYCVNILNTGLQKGVT